MQDINIGTWLLVLATFFVAGLASMWQSFKNSRTSTDKETGVWLSVGMVLAGIGGTGIIFIFLTH